jgi:hypothetical protein
MKLKHPQAYYKGQTKVFENSFDHGIHEIIRLDTKREDTREALEKAAKEIHDRAFQLFDNGNKLNAMADYLKLDDAVIKNKKALFESHTASLLRLDKEKIKFAEDAKKKIADFQRVQKELLADTKELMADKTLPKNSPERVTWLKLAAEYQTLDRDSKSYFEDIKEGFKPCSLDKLKKEFILKQQVRNKAFDRPDIEDCEV